MGLVLLYLAGKRFDVAKRARAGLLSAQGYYRPVSGFYVNGGSNAEVVELCAVAEANGLPQRMERCPSSAGGDVPTPNSSPYNPSSHFTELEGARSIHDSLGERKRLAQLCQYMDPNDSCRIKLERCNADTPYRMNECKRA